MAVLNILSSFRDGIVILSSAGMATQAKYVAHRLQGRGAPIEYDQVKHKLFNCNETYVEIGPNVRHKKVFLFHDFKGDPDKAVMTLLITCDALRHAMVGSITLVLPYMPYLRQDRVSGSKREPFTAKLLASLISENKFITNVVTFDMHAPQISGFFNGPHVENIPGHAIFAPYIRQRFYNRLDEITILTTDVGGSKRGQSAAEWIREGTPVAITDKRRDNNGDSEALKIVGEVKTLVLPYDDIGDSLDSLLAAADLGRAAGAKDVIAFIAHGLMSKKKGITAEAKLKASGIELVMTDSLPHTSAYLKRNNITEVSYQGLMVEIITALITVDGSMRRAVRTWTGAEMMMT